MAISALETSNGGVASKIRECRWWHILVTFLVIAIIVVAIVVPVVLTRNSDDDNNSSGNRKLLSVAFLAEDPVIPNANQSEVNTYYMLDPIIISIQTDANIVAANPISGFMGLNNASATANTFNFTNWLYTTLHCVQTDVSIIKCSLDTAVSPGQYILTVQVNDQYYIQTSVNIKLRIQDSSRFMSLIENHSGWQGTLNGSVIDNFYSLALQPLSAIVDSYNSVNPLLNIHFNATAYAVSAADYYMNYNWSYSTTDDDDFQILVMLGESAENLRVAGLSFPAAYSAYISELNPGSLDITEYDQILRANTYFLDTLSSLVFNSVGLCSFTINQVKCKRVVFALGGSFILSTITSIGTELTNIQVPQTSSNFTVALSCGVNTNVIQKRMEYFSVSQASSTAQLFPSVVTRLSGTIYVIQVVLTLLPMDDPRFPPLVGLIQGANAVLTALRNPRPQVSSQPLSDVILNTTYCNGTSDSLYCDCSHIPFMSPIQTQTISVNPTVSGWDVPFYYVINSTLISTMTYNATYQYNNDCSSVAACCCPDSGLAVNVTYMPNLNGTVIFFGFHQTSSSVTCGDGQGDFLLPYQSPTAHWVDDSDTDIVVTYTNGYRHVLVTLNNVCTYSFEM